MDKERRDMLIVKKIKDGQDYCWPTHTNSLLIDRKDTKGSEVFLTTIEPGRGTHCHSHKDNEQLYYVIKGEGLISYCSQDETTYKKAKIAPEQIVFIPIETKHQVLCNGKEPLVYLTVDVFPNGKPADELTWEAHAKKLAIETKVD